MPADKFFTVSGNGILVDYPVGQQLTINGKQCIVKEAKEGTATECCKKCAVTPKTRPVSCKNLACGMYEQEDAKEVYFKQI